MNRACSRVSKTGSGALGYGVGFSVLLPREQPKVWCGLDHKAGTSVG